MPANITALIITAVIVLTVVCIGFIAGRDKSSRTSVEEWSVGGRRFGGLLVWFLVGADLYTAYTFLGLTSTAYTGEALLFLQSRILFWRILSLISFCRSCGKWQKYTN
ncbi:putative symporter YodF [Bacillus velezensis]|nr:putative symporter YodF [Bacillus velezensis]